MNAETVGAIIGGFVGLCAVVGIMWSIVEQIFKRKR